jgi:signal transduction histidine kinase
VTGRLRAGLVVVALAAVCALVWTTTVAGVRRADRPSVAAYDAEQVVEARMAAASLEEWFAAARAQLAGARDALGPWSGSTPQAALARPVLDRAQAAAPLLDDGLYVLDARSQVAATSTSLAILERQTRKSGAVTQALAKGVDGNSDVADDPLLRERHVSFVTPLRDGRGGITGALVGLTRVPTGTLSTKVGATEATLGRPLVLVTPGGTLVDGAIDKPPSLRRVDDNLRYPVSLTPGGPGFARYDGEAGAGMVAAYAPVAGGWSVVLPRPRAGEVVTGDRATNAAAAALAVVLVGAFAAVAILFLLLRARARNVEEAKQSFLAIAGHELRTPLTVMKGFADLLVDRWDQVPDESRHSIVETISFQVRNLEHLVERLLLGAQLGAGVSPSISHQAVPLAPLLADTAAHHATLAPTHDFLVDAPGELQAWADRKALDHVLTNLVENAVKYSPNGGTVTLRATTARGARVRIVVEDEGIGLPNDLDAIFEKFVQREDVDTRTHDEGGVGLGLYIVRTLVEQMGGAVRAERRAPAGARLIVTLPTPK